MTGFVITEVWVRKIFSPKQGTKIPFGSYLVRLLGSGDRPPPLLQYAQGLGRPVRLAVQYPVRRVFRDLQRRPQQQNHRQG